MRGKEKKSETCVASPISCVVILIGLNLKGEEIFCNQREKFENSHRRDFPFNKREKTKKQKKIAGGKIPPAEKPH